jgi:hypothetical protein
MKLCKFIAAFVVFCGLFAFRSDTIEFDTKALLGNQVELKIPKGFIIMPEEMAKLKYASERRPTLIYSNETGDISVTLNITNTKATQAEIPVLKENLLNTYRRQYVGAKEKWDGLRVVNGRQVGFIEFGTVANQNTVYGTSALEFSSYNLIFFTDFRGMLLLCTVTCTNNDTKQWKQAAKEIMASLKMK